jgi:hypothetical protein
MHGGSWRSVIAAESVAGLVKKIPYDEEGDVDLLEKISIMISKDIPTKIEQAVIKDYQTKVNNEIKNAIIPRITTGSDTIQGETIDKFLETFVDQSVKTTSDGVVNSGVNRIHENVSTIKQEVGY